MIRPGITAFLRNHFESLFALAVLCVAIWTTSRGGWIMTGVGFVVGLAATGLAIGAMRRERFQLAPNAPGLVEVDEAQVAYFGPDGGGFVSIRELVEIRRVDIRGRAHWRLKQADGQALLIPVAAEGAAQLYDAFVTLPGIDLGAFTAALDAPGSTGPLWQRDTIILTADTGRTGP